MDGGSLDTSTTAKTHKVTVVGGVERRQVNVGDRWHVKVGHKVHVSKLAIHQSGNFGHIAQERVKLLSHSVGTGTSSTKDVFDFRGNTVGQVGQGEAVRAVKDVKNLGNNFTELLADLALLSKELFRRFEFGGKLSRGLLVDNRGLDAVNGLGLVDCRKRKKKGKSVRKHQGK